MEGWRRSRLLSTKLSISPSGCPAGSFSGTATLGGVCTHPTGISSKAEPDSEGVGWGQRCCPLTGWKIRMLAWGPRVGGRAAGYHLGWLVPSSSSACLTAGPSCWQPQLPLCTGAVTHKCLGQGVCMFALGPKTLSHE